MGFMTEVVISSVMPVRLAPRDLVKTRLSILSLQCDQSFVGEILRFRSE